MAALGAGESRREHQVFALLVQERNARQPVRGAYRGLQGIGQAGPDVVSDAKSVNHDLDGVLFVLVQSGKLVQVGDDTVNPGANEAVGAEFVEHMQMFALAPFYDGRKQHDSGTFRQVQDLIGHLADGPGLEPDAVIGAVGLSHAREQEPQIVIDFGNCADSGPGIVAAGFLFDTDCRRKAVDVVDVRFFHHRQKLSRIGGQRFDVPSLTLGVQRVEGERGLSRPGEPGDHDQPVAWNVEVDVLEVMRPRTTNGDVAHMRLFT